MSGGGGGNGSASASAVAITGLGTLSPVGGCVEELLDALLAGRDGIAPLGARMRTASLRGRLGGALGGAKWLEALRPHDDDPGLGDDPALRVALPAAFEAYRGAGLDGGALPSARIGLVLGTSAGGMISRALYEDADPADPARRHRLLLRANPSALTSAIAAALSLGGPRITISTACTSSTNAIVHARDLLLGGGLDAVLAGGVDVIVEEIVAGFVAMGAMSERPCAPFSLPIGMTIGEGAGFVVLERPEAAARRGVRVRAIVLGGALTADAYHRTAPAPTGAGVARALSLAMADAGITSDEVGYVNAHGSGTDANDAAEWRGIERALGAEAARTPVSSSKGYFGHALGAAGVLESIATILCQERGLVPPTLHWDGPRSPAPPDPIAAPTPRAHRYELALKSSSGFGGANAALVIATPSRSPSHGGAPPARRARERVFVVGAAAIGPFGAGGFGAFDGFDAFDRALRDARPAWASDAGSAHRRWSGRVPPLHVARLLRGVDPRGMPTIARYLALAAKGALDDAELRVAGELRDRVGLFVGAWRPGWDVSREFFGSRRARGFERVSAPAFAHLTLNAHAGAVSTALGLRGPETVVAGGLGATLAALLLARAALSARGDADALVVGSASEVCEEALADHAAEFAGEPDELAPFGVYAGALERAVLGEGAACVVLAAERHLERGGAKPIGLVAGGSAAPSGALARAIGEALAEAGLRPDEIDAVYGCADGHASSATREREALRAVFGARLRTLPLANPAPVVGSASGLGAFSRVAAVTALRSGAMHPTAGELDPELLLDGGVGRGGRGGHEGRAVRRLLVIVDAELGGARAVVLEACADLPGL